MLPAIHVCQPDRETLSEECCYILELSNSDDDAQCSIARARVPPGVTTRWHRLSEIIERYVVLAGEGRAEIGDAAPATVQPGDVVLIPAGVRQRITATGASDLVFLAICTPRFRWAAYQQLD